MTDFALLGSSRSILLDRLMYVSPHTSLNFNPQHFLDLEYGWDKRYCKDFGQPFSPFNFAQNCSSVLGSVAGCGLISKLTDQIDYLVFVANKYIERSGSFYIKNQFPYSNLFCELHPGWRGAFMNAYTAYGYMFLWRACGKPELLNDASNLLAGIVSGSDIPLAGDDESGNYFFYEYVFKTNDLYHLCLSEFGLSTDADGYIRAPVFNGHIHTIFAFLQYQELTGDNQFVRYVERALVSMENRLLAQINAIGEFLYIDKFPLLLDYSQTRPVHQAEGLSELFPDNAIFKAIAAKFSDIYPSTELALQVEKKFSEEGYFHAREIFNKRLRQLA